MKHDVIASLALILPIIVTAGTVGWFSLKRYASAHCHFKEWQGPRSNPNS